VSASTALVAEASAAVPPGPRSVLVRWAPAAVTVAGTGVLLAAIGTAPWDLLRYSAYLAWGVLLPGMLVYRALRRRAYTLVEDVTIGAVVGLCLEIAAWATFAMLGIQRWLVAWPLVVVGLFLAVPRLRRHWRRPSYEPTPLGWSWAVAGLALAYTLYTTVGLRPYRPDPSTGGGWYMIDSLYQLSLVGEARQHFPLHTPQVATEPLHYHWFAFANEATGTLISGVDPATVFFRLAMPAVALLSVLTLAVAGWRISGRPWVGVVAAALTFTIGETVVGALSDTSTGTVNTTAWVSHSAAYSVPIATALGIAVADRLTARPASPPSLGTGAWPLMALFALGCAGEKSSVLPVVICGAITAAVAHFAVTRRIRPAIVGTLAVLIGALGFGIVAVYRFESHGLSLSPLQNLAFSLQTDDRRSWSAQAAVTVLVLGAYCLYLLSRLAGIPVLLWRRRLRLADAEWFLVGAGLAGVAATLLLASPSSSQIYFVRSGWVFAAIASAIGYSELVERHRIRPRTLAVVVVASIGITFAVTALLWAHGDDYRGTGWRYLLPVYKLGLVYTVLAATAACCWLLLRRTRARLPGLGATAALSFILLTGSPGLVQDAYVGRLNNRQHTSEERIRPEAAQAARWLRGHSQPDDLLATNQHGLEGNGLPLSFWLSAYTERRELVGSWAYAPRTVSTAQRQHLNPAAMQFWDQDLLTANDLVFTDPTPDRVDRLRRYGVRWLVVNRMVGTESAALRQYATIRIDHPTIAVYELDIANS
jgi:hypothetical protein